MRCDDNESDDSRDSDASKDPATPRNKHQLVSGGGAAAAAAAVISSPSAAATPPPPGVTRGGGGGARGASEARRLRDEPTAQQRLDAMRTMPTLAHFRDWSERPRVSERLRIDVGTHYHEKLLRQRRRDIANGKSCGQNALSDHACLHQLEPFREMDPFTQSLFLRGIRKPLPSPVSAADSVARSRAISKASKELATAQALDRVLVVTTPPPMRFSK